MSQPLQFVKPPLFRYYYQGRGRYKVYVGLSGGAEVFLGEIETTAPVAFSSNPGKWRALSGPLDSMTDAAMELYEQSPTVKSRRAA